MLYVDRGAFRNFVQFFISLIGQNVFDRALEMVKILLGMQIAQSCITKEYLILILETWFVYESFNKSWGIHVPHLKTCLYFIQFKYLYFESMF